MERYCKNIDITEIGFIVNAIETFMKNRSRKERRRKDIRRLYKKYKDEEGIAKFLRDAFIAYRDHGIPLPLTPVMQKDRMDRGSEKIRKISVEGIVQQLYDQIACEALKDAMPVLGYYQACCVKNLPAIVVGNQIIKTKGKGQKWAVGIVREWMAESDVKYVVDADIKKNYDSIPHDSLISRMRKIIKNEDLMILIIALLSTVPQKEEERPKGLLIGSVLSIYLDAFYLAKIYHDMSEKSYYVRHGKRGDIKVRTVKHIFVWMDNIPLFCSSMRLAKAALHDLKKSAESLGLEIKGDVKIIRKRDPVDKKDKNKPHGKSYFDFIGFRIYPDHVTLRRRNYIKARRVFKQAQRVQTITYREAQTIMSYKAMLDIADSKTFCDKYDVYKTCRKARRIISKHDKESNFRQQTAVSADLYS